MAKTIALFGATGGTGREILQQALARGYTVRALARTPDKLAPAPDGLTIIQGDVLDPTPVAETVAGCDAVVVTLGNTSGNPDFVVSDGTRQILAAMTGQGIRRLLVVTSLGVGDSKDQVPLAFKLLMKAALRKVMEDKERQETLVRASGLDWTIIRPGGLVDGPVTGDYRVGTDKSLKAGRVARADVAAFLLDQLESDKYAGEAVAIT